MFHGLMPRNFFSSFHKVLLNCVPLSQVISSWTPNLATQWWRTFLPVTCQVLGLHTSGLGERSDYIHMDLSKSSIRQVAISHLSVCVWSYLRCLTILTCLAPMLSYNTVYLPLVNSRPLSLCNNPGLPPGQPCSVPGAHNWLLRLWGWWLRWYRIQPSYPLLQLLQVVLLFSSHWYGVCQWWRRRWTLFCILWKQNWIIISWHSLKLFYWLYISMRDF